RGETSEGRALGGRDSFVAWCDDCLTRTRPDIPMMDFRCTPSASNLDRIQRALRALGQSAGAVLASGRSYHFYGFQLLPPNEWSDFLARCLLLAPLVD